MAASGRYETVPFVVAPSWQVTAIPDGSQKQTPKKNGETRVPILVIAEGFALRCCDTSARWRASAVCAGAVFDGLRGNPERVTEIAR
jgi:hypothetical protein